KNRPSRTPPRPPPPPPPPPPPRAPPPTPPPAGVGNRAPFRASGPPPRPFRDVAPDALHGAKRLIAKFRIRDTSPMDRDEHFARDSEHEEFLMRKTTCVLHGLSPFTPLKD